jgi:hypothetical protein
MTIPPQEPMADVGEMYLVHTMFRREFSLLPDLIRGADRNDAKRRALIGAHAQLLCQILHTHHEGEDLVLWPLLLERAEAEATEIVAVMEEQHQAIAAAHDEAVHRLGRWCRFGRDGEGFASVLDDLVQVLTEHTALEEQAVLPLAEKYITAAEWAQMSQHGMNTFQKRLLPLAFGMLMYEGDPAVMRRTLSSAPLPARLLIPIIAPRAFRRHARRVYGTATPPKITLYDGKSVEGWCRGFVGQSQSAFVERFADDIVLEATTLAKPVEGKQNVADVLAAASSIYESLEFTADLQNASTTYLQWRATAFGGMQIDGITILERNTSGKIVAAAIHHRPVGAVLRFSAEIRDRLAGVIPADHFLKESA